MSVTRPIPCFQTAAAIETIAERCASMIGFRPGDDLHAIIERLGGRVRYRSFFTGKHRIALDVRGLRDFDLFLPTETPACRDRFSMAHELGHLVLHYPRINPSRMKVDRYISDAPDANEVRCEAEANIFAAALLMPASAFSSAWQEEDGAIEALAERFFVSIQAANDRASYLSLC